MHPGHRLPRTARSRHRLPKVAALLLGATTWLPGPSSSLRSPSVVRFRTTSPSGSPQRQTWRRSFPACSGRKGAYTLEGFGVQPPSFAPGQPQPFVPSGPPSESCMQAAFQGGQRVCSRPVAIRPAHPRFLTRIEPAAAVSRAVPRIPRQNGPKRTSNSPMLTLS